MTPRRAFIAGATGAVGQTLLALAEGRPIEIVPHVRPASAARHALPDAAVVDLDDHDGLVAAMTGCTTVVQLIGTMRKRFASGDTYETSDIGTTRSLMAAAKVTGVDHVVLLSSVGAGVPVGAYLAAKAKAEALVTGSGIDATIVRPSAFDGPDRRPPPGMRGLTRLLGLRKYQPIRLVEVAGAILFAVETRASIGPALEGAALWSLVEAAAAAGCMKGGAPR